MDQHRIDWPSFGTCVAVIVLIASLPILIIGVFMSISLVKSLKADTGT